MCCPSVMSEMRGIMATPVATTCLHCGVFVCLDEAFVCIGRPSCFLAAILWRHLSLFGRVLWDILLSSLLLCVEHKCETYIYKTGITPPWASDFTAQWSHHLICANDSCYIDNHIFVIDNWRGKLYNYIWSHTQHSLASHHSCRFHFFVSFSLLLGGHGLTSTKLCHLYFSLPQMCLRSPEKMWDMCFLGGPKSPKANLPISKTELCNVLKNVFLPSIQF